MIGIIGGSGVYEITSKADSVEKKIVSTDYGDVEVSILDIFSKKLHSFRDMPQAIAFPHIRLISEPILMHLKTLELLRYWQQIL